MKKTKYFVCTLLFSLGMTLTSIGATLSDFKRVNWDIPVSSEKMECIDTSIKNIPSNVVDLYNNYGGTITFTDEVLDNDKYLNGIYWHDTYNIEIRIRNEEEEGIDYNLAKILPHELGHFVYFRTYDKWEDFMKDSLFRSFDYWSKYNLDCYDREETFAELYAWQMLEYDKWDFVNYANKLCGEELVKKE